MNSLARNLRRKRQCRPQYRLRLEGGRCLTMFEVGQVHGKRRKCDLVLAIYGDLRMAEHYRQKYNELMKDVGLKAEIWAYYGSKPDGQLTGYGEKD